jgi:hypothetical protein
MKRLWFALILTSSFALAIAQAQNNQTQPRGGAGMPMMMGNCLTNLPGTTVTATDTATGIALTFTTKPENVAELRRRIEQMAAMHSVEHPSPAMMQGQMMPGTVKYEAVENGARLTLTPRDPAKLAEFRTQVRAHVEQMKQGQCGMMTDMMQGMMHGMRGGKGPATTPPKTEGK